MCERLRIRFWLLDLFIPLVSTKRTPAYGKADTYNRGGFAESPPEMS